MLEGGKTRAIKIREATSVSSGRRPGLSSGGSARTGGRPQMAAPGPSSSTVGKFSAAGINKIVATANRKKVGGRKGKAKDTRDYVSRHNIGAASNAVQEAKGKRGIQ